MPAGHMPGCHYLFSVPPVQTWVSAHTDVFGSTEQKWRLKVFWLCFQQMGTPEFSLQGGRNGLRDQEAGAMNNFPETRDSTLP